ncbi:MAG: hypothetical protein KJI69_03925 [Patescibacteria group bacterium]|nr:hypothetical protein [Patescibacteria group bacterium]
MSNDQNQKLHSPLKSKYVLITDPKVLEKIKAEEEEAIKKGEQVLYIAPNETEETFDQEIISGSGHDLKKSSEEVGQLRPLEVAIWFGDPNKDSQNSNERIHRRIINGRHRHRADPTWRREYYDFAGFATEDKPLAPAIEYHLAKGHFDMQKKATKGERTVWTRNMCVLGMKNGISKADCCNWVVQLANAQGISNENSIREVCDEQFKNKEMSKRKLDKTFESKGIDTKEIKKLKKVAGEKYVEMEAKKLRLETENTQYQKEILALKEDNSKTMKINDDLQQQLRLVANIQQEHLCKKCGTVSEIKVDASTGKVNISQKK